MHDPHEQATPALLARCPRCGLAGPPCQGRLPRCWPAFFFSFRRVSLSFLSEPCKCTRNYFVLSRKLQIKGKQDKLLYVQFGALFGNPPAPPCGAPSWPWLQRPSPDLPEPVGGWRAQGSSVQLQVTAASPRPQPLSSPQWLLKGGRRTVLDGRNPRTGLHCLAKSLPPPTHPICVLLTAGCRGLGLMVSIVTESFLREPTPGGADSTQASGVSDTSVTRSTVVAAGMQRGSSR